MAHYRLYRADVAQACQHVCKEAGLENLLWYQQPSLEEKHAREPPEFLGPGNSCIAILSYRKANLDRGLRSFVQRNKRDGKQIQLFPPTPLRYSGCCLNISSP